MKISCLAWAVAAAAGVTSFARIDEARACGACFVSQSESTQVTGHRMILSISQKQTTLFDQIEYTGAPSSFSWVLPVKGTIDVGLSSDLLFNSVDAGTAVTINSPSVSCGGGGSGVSTVASSSANGGMEGDPVEVIANKTVGPYETVQLKSTDSQALAKWLGLHGYVIPAELEPTVSAYVADGFDFLAVKLVPGAMVTAMRPIRVTVPGASLALPLRMVAAGTGANTLLTLWIISEARYEPANFPVLGEVRRGECGGERLW